MANHVYNYITIQTENKECQAEWDKLFTNYHEEVERPSYHGDGTIKIREYMEIQKHPFLEGYTEEGWYDWGCENVGAKWAHIEDADETSAYICSAWSPITPYLEKLLNHLVKFDESVIIQCNYEDEFRNFVGVWHNDDYEEIDGEDLTEKFEKQYKVDLSSDEFDWSDEHKDTGMCYDELFDSMVSEWFEEAM